MLAEAQTVIRGSSRADTGTEQALRKSRDQTPASVAKVLLGQRLNHFLLEEFIGGGGMGAVFRAHDEQLDRTVAIKVIPFVGDDLDLKRRFRNEAQSAAKLDHPQIAKVFDVGTDDDWHYIVFEYIQGINIRDFVQREGVLSVDESVYFTCQLADALGHASERGIVHRDIKPSNVLIGENNAIKLVDMGLARSDNLDLSEDMTASGVTLGTFDYISPEQANDPRDADLRSDIYSLGCTLYFMLAGEPPYPGGTMLQKLIHHGKSPPPDVRIKNELVSSDLSAVIQKMLGKRPEDRYQTAQHLVADLHEVARREGLGRVESLGFVAPPIRGPWASFLEKHTPWMVAASLMLLVTAGLAIASELRRDQFVVEIPSRQSIQRLPTTNKSISLDDGTKANELNPALVSDRALSSVGDPNGTMPIVQSGRTPSDSSIPPALPGKLPLPSELATDMVLSPNADRSSSDVIDPEDSIERPGSSDGKGGILSNSTRDPDWKPQAIRVLTAKRFKDLDTSETEDVAFAGSLDQAIRLANTLQCDRIEIDEPIIRSGPIEVVRDGLLITSAVGGSVVSFESQQSSPMQRMKLMSIGSNRIEFEDIHFSWSVPVGSMSGGSLFSIRENRLIRFTDCSVTISNPVRHPDVFAFQVETTQDDLPTVTPIESQTETSFKGVTLPLVSIEMYNVCIRGQMTMLHMDTVAELQLRWENGLLAVTGRMIESAGAPLPPVPSSRPIQLLLERLIAVTDNGLAQMRLDAAHPHPLPIDRDAKYSVFCVQPDTALFEFVGIDRYDEVEPLLVLRGEANAYDTDPDLTDPMLRLVELDGKEHLIAMSTFRADSPNWSKENSQRWAVDWESEKKDLLPASQLEPVHFRQYGAVISGFDEQSLTIISPLDRLSRNDENND